MARRRPYAAPRPTAWPVPPRPERRRCARLFEWLRGGHRSAVRTTGKR